MGGIVQEKGYASLSLNFVSSVFVVLQCDDNTIFDARTSRYIEAFGVILRLPSELMQQCIARG